jgi:hypothetical protein
MPVDRRAVQRVPCLTRTVNEAAPLEVQLPVIAVADCRSEALSVMTRKTSRRPVELLGFVRPLRRRRSLDQG